MRPTLHTEGHSIVFLGAFNPRIFQPSWFAHQGLIREEESQSAKIEIVHREAVVFMTEWFRLEVVQERVHFATTQSQFFEPLRDLALGTFRILSHTPLAQLGINRDMHFSMDTEDERDALYEKIAPRDPWRKVFAESKLATMSVISKRPDGYQGAIVVKVEASQRATPGVYISVNDHFERKDQGNPEGANELLSILEATWEESTARSLQLAKNLLGA